MGERRGRINQIQPLSSPNALALLDDGPPSYLSSWAVFTRFTSPYKAGRYRRTLKSELPDGHPAGVSGAQGDRLVYGGLTFEVGPGPKQDNVSAAGIG